MNDISRISQVVVELPPERQLLKTGLKNPLDKNKNVTIQSITIHSQDYGEFYCLTA